ncbi:MAG: FMN-binding protein [Gammaproteobacteria bacterium]
MLIVDLAKRIFPILVLLVASCPSYAKIYYSKSEAMEIAFGKDASVETLSLFPSDEELAAIEQLAQVKLDSKMFTFYVGKRQDNILAYAAIETRTVRTKPETLLIVLEADGTLRGVTTLAFHEPPEYQAPDRWFAQLVKKPLDELSFNAGVQGITGATLSTRSALDSVRKVLAVYQIMIKEK